MHDALALAPAIADFGLLCWPLPHAPAPSVSSRAARNISSPPPARQQSRDASRWHSVQLRHRKCLSSTSPTRSVQQYSRGASSTVSLSLFLVVVVFSDAPHQSSRHWHDPPCIRLLSLCTANSLEHTVLTAADNLECVCLSSTLQIGQENNHVTAKNACRMRNNVNVVENYTSLAERSK